jgi:signal transduction histidine kinase
VVEDDAILRETIPLLLEQQGYDVSVARNGCEALAVLRSYDRLPDVILLDLRMPVMDGWEFRTLQKNDPKLSAIPVIALSADGSPQAASISVDAYLRKPIGTVELLTHIENVLQASRRRVAERVSETERLASLGRLAAGIGHEINNPLTYLMLNLGQALDTLRPCLPATNSSALRPPPAEVELAQLKVRLATAVDMLEDSVVGGERIRATVSNLQRLSQRDDCVRGPVDVHLIIEQSVSIVWTQIRHRARLIKAFGDIPVIRGDATALGQVFLNLLLNAAQAMPEGGANRNEIRVSTRMAAGEHGRVVLVEVSDTGTGIDAGTLPHIFDPFFTTKQIGEGTGLGLSISRQTVADHGGRLTVQSTPGEGTVFRVFLPVGNSTVVTQVPPASPGTPAQVSGRVLVIDDEPLIGRVIRNSLKTEHEVVVVETAGAAIARLDVGEKFDLIICDVVMPDVTGPEFHDLIAERWPDMLARLVFMTGGAFTPGTALFLERLSSSVLVKPFKVDLLRLLVHERIRGDA